MTEAYPEPPPYRIETDIIPAGVDTTLAGQRSALIERWRDGAVDAAATYTALEHLYWQNQPTADVTTRAYLRETAYCFPVESGMDEDLVDTLYTGIQEQYS